ncbi:lasso peptide biosynthesis B2 protein [Erythrobacter sp. MTPC3]|uniref:lasso peptide biosynthesis B2 protein n=1 Tax=Erythrobacter sp. MTPC3 TaxID=3056564 RepID=UPI0036F3E97D
MSLTRSLKKTVLKAEIVLGLASARMLIALVPFRWWKHRIGVIGSDAELPAERLTPMQRKQAGDIGRIIKRIARQQKFQAVCFPQAITGRWVLGRRGIPSQIVIGTRPDKDSGGIAMHAWLEVGDLIVTGQDEYAEYQAFKRRSPAVSKGR